MKDYNIEKVNPRNLFFDYKNPRISEFKVDKSTPENEIIRILWSSMGVEEIVLSIKASGFFEHEPLIGTIEDGEKIIIEGNRRLAAIKVILNPQILNGINYNANIFSIDPIIIDELRTIPVIFVKNRKDAWKYIGFKHINGPAKWGSYAKAQYISEIKNQYDVPLTQIAEQLGDTHKTVQKLYQGLQVIEQGENQKIFDRADIQDNRLYFSHLYTALTYEGIKTFLGIQDSVEDKVNPVPKEKLENLELFLHWLYGSRSKKIEKIIVSQNPDLRRLESAIQSKEGIYALKDGLPLIVAYEISQPKDKAFEQSLLEAKRALQKAQSLQTEGYDGNEEMLKLSGTIANISEDLYKSMEVKYQTLIGGIERKRISE
jgi:hypothetical protein